jgi:hypothetical protein
LIGARFAAAVSGRAEKRGKREGRAGGRKEGNRRADGGGVRRRGERAEEEEAGGGKEVTRGLKAAMQGAERRERRSMKVLALPVRSLRRWRFLLRTWDGKEGEGEDGGLGLSGGKRSGMELKDPRQRWVIYCLNGNCMKKALLGLSTCRSSPFLHPPDVLRSWSCRAPV